MNDIQAKLADINARAFAHLTEHNRLIGAVNAAVTLILLLAVVGGLYGLGSRLDEHFHQQDLIAQESNYHG